MTPRMLSAWVELITRAEIARDVELMYMIRNSKADLKVFKKLIRKLEDQSQ